MAKVHEIKGKGYSLWVFTCPGCKTDHPFTVGSPTRPNWTFNGNPDRPTFTPSLLCNPDHPASRCHSYVTDGNIQFLDDCHHDLKGQTVPLPEYEE